MQAQIGKWGNSLALRIPKAYAEEAGISYESPVDIQISDGKLVISVVETSTYSLDDLLSQITPENIHDEIDMGSEMGTEAW